MTIATAQANPNLVFIKYWGNREIIYQVRGVDHQNSSETLHNPGPDNPTRPLSISLQPILVALTRITHPSCSDLGRSSLLDNLC